MLSRAVKFTLMLKYDSECVADTLRIHASERRAIPLSRGNVPAVASAIIYDASVRIRRSGSPKVTVQILTEALSKVESIRLAKSDDAIVARP